MLIKKTTEPVLPFVSPKTAQGAFYRPQTDKHSDLTASECQKRSGVTVMAVAADFHRDFLVPECTVKRRTRQRRQKTPMICVYSFVPTILSHFGRKSNGFRRKSPLGLPNHLAVDEGISGGGGDFERTAVV